MALSSLIHPPFAPAGWLPSLKSAKPLSRLLVLSYPVRRRTRALNRTSRRLRVEATATLESTNGSVGVRPENRKDESASDSQYGRQFFPLAAVVGQLCFLSLTVVLGCY